MFLYEFCRYVTWRHDVSDPGMAPDRRTGRSCFAAVPGTAVVASLLIGRVKATPQNLVVAGSVLYFLSGLWWFLTLSDHTDNAWLLNYLPGLIMTGPPVRVSRRRALWQVRFPGFRTICIRQEQG